MTYLNNGPALRTLEQKHLECAANSIDVSAQRARLSLATRFGLLAFSAEYNTPINHTHDDQCTIDPATGLCFDCGVLHGDPCPSCEQKAFHLDSCPIYLDSIEMSHPDRQPIRVSDHEDNIGGYPDAPFLLYVAVALLVAGWLTEIGLHLHN